MDGGNGGDDSGSKRLLALFVVLQEGLAATHPDSFDVRQALDLGRVYTQCKAELMTLERTLEFMRAEHENYAEFKPANQPTREMMRSYLCQTKKLIDLADYYLERVSVLKSIVRLHTPFRLYAFADLA